MREMGTTKHDQIARTSMGGWISRLEMQRNNGLGGTRSATMLYKGWVGDQNGKIWMLRNY